MEAESVFVYKNSCVIGFLLSQEWVYHVVSRLPHILLFIYFIVSYGFKHPAGTVMCHNLNLLLRYFFVFQTDVFIKIYIIALENADMHNNILYVL